ncbi:hypothetical protein FBUS_03220 [Fasciolopsis buskii]|uniref:Uncharacterized protein n=1 Tax=Fasciolopsis buskii TaxID=27845 RepID=A0A8E0RKR8_9TREM|nr:hypothetical protein FBUS_03220 [Fasciolopsis buski]
MSDIPNPGHIYTASYPNTGPINLPSVGTGGDLSQRVTHPMQIGSVPVYRVALPQSTLGPGPIPMSQPGPTVPGLGAHTMVTVVPNPGTMPTTGQMPFTGQMIPQTVQSPNPTARGFKRLLTEMSKLFASWYNLKLISFNGNGV